MRRYTIILLIILLAGATYLTNFFIAKQRSFDENLRLKTENENLRTQIQKSQLPLVNCLSATTNGSSSVITAEVFSTYPFNIKNQITVNAGEKQGVKKMMTATVDENILLGQVVNVFINYSVIQTIFDPNFQLSVRIGDKQIDGFLQGGNAPKVTLIEKNKQIQTGDIVYSASQEFAYGLKIGEISEINETSAGVFKEATLKMPFNVNELREIQIMK